MTGIYELVGLGDSTPELPEIEYKDKVRTAAGARKYGQPIGTEIVKDPTQAVRRAVKKTAASAKRATAAGKAPAKRAPAAGKPPAKRAPAKRAAPPAPNTPAPIHRNAQARAAGAELNARGKKRRYVGPEQHSFPGLPLGAWTKERMERKIEEDAQNGSRRQWILTDRDAKKAEARIREAFGDNYANQFAGVWKKRKNQDASVSRTGSIGHIVVPENFDDHEAKDAWIVQRYSSALTSKAGGVATMKWQPTNKPGSLAAGRRKKWRETKKRLEGLFKLEQALDKKVGRTPITYSDPYAAMMAVMVKTGFRPETDGDLSGGEQVSVGATNMRKQNLLSVNTRSGKIVFEFIPGKAAKEVSKDGTVRKQTVTIEMEDMELARLLRHWTKGKGPDDWLISNPDGTNLSPNTLNRRFSEASGGNLTSKSVRTELASKLAMESVDSYLNTNLPLPKNATQMQTLINELAGPAMRQLGHDKVSTTTENYINPDIWLRLGDESLLPKVLHEQLVKGSYPIGGQ